MSDRRYECHGNSGPTDCRLSELGVLGPGAEVGVEAATMQDSNWRESWAWL